MVQQSSERFFVPEIRQGLERSLGAYQELARVTKEGMRDQATLLATEPALLTALQKDEPSNVTSVLSEALRIRPNVASLTLLDADEQPLAVADRGRPVDDATEHELTVQRPVRHGETRLTLQVQFVTPRDRFNEFAQMGEFVEAYSKLESRREADERTYWLAFSALLGVTIVAAIAVGILLARGVTRRIVRLARATAQVGTGDLSVRVVPRGADEITDLYLAFNRMVAEVDRSRRRIEYLSRLASWQEMARRLAHEIKNPLTPIQLAVQEVHQRLTDLPPAQKQLVDVTLEIVQTEVQTLRRLVTEFSEFARLPESKLHTADMFTFLRELQQETALSASYLTELGEVEPAVPVSLQFDVPSGGAAVAMDTQMMRRVLINLIRNAVQASASAEAPLIRLSARSATGGYVIDVDDNGPGVELDLREQIFEPYVSTKDRGTGLGLAIVKKVVIDHGGQIEVLEGPLGGARVRIWLPAL
jgi:nitrogen fixation/metabolism regulation signal transduction histidine kinase